MADSGPNRSDPRENRAANPYVVPEPTAEDPALQPDSVGGDFRQDSMATTSLVLGFLSLFSLCIPCVGLPLAVAGIATGIRGLAARQRAPAICGIGLSILGLLPALFEWAVLLWRSLQQGIQ